MAGIGFSGYFGMNDTLLTEALKSGDFVTAEEALEENNYNAMLDDGPYQNIPLHLCLTTEQGQPRNLRLARMLVVKGADTNLRPTLAGDIDSRSPSPFEELVTYHELLRAEVAGYGLEMCKKLHLIFECFHDRIAFLTSTVDLNGNTSKQCLASCKHLLNHTNFLISSFLNYGADPNLPTTFNHKPVFNWVVEQCDIRLAKVMLNTQRVKLDNGDLHGNSALMNAILMMPPRGVMELYDAAKKTGQNFNLNASNCCGENTLFRAAFAGHTELAIRLVQDGAMARSPPYQGGRNYFTDCNQAKSIVTIPCLVTPLLAPLLADAPIRQIYEQKRDFFIQPRAHKNLIDKIVSAAISPLLDTGALTNQTSQYKFINMLLNFTNFGYLNGSDMDPSDLQVLMFGQTSAGLRQLCVRKIFDIVFPDYLANFWYRRSHNYCGMECNKSLSKSVILQKIESLGLPPMLSIFFEVEAAKHQLCGIMVNLQSLDCQRACSDSEDITDSDSGSEISEISDHSGYSEPQMVRIIDSSDVIVEVSEYESDEEEMDEQDISSVSGLEEDMDYFEPAAPGFTPESSDGDIQYKRFKDDSSASSITPPSNSPSHTVPHHHTVIKVVSPPNVSVSLDVPRSSPSDTVSIIHTFSSEPVVNVVSRSHKLPRVSLESQTVPQVGSQFHTVPRVGSQFHNVSRDGSQFHTVPRVGSQFHTVSRDGSQFHTVPRVGSQFHTVSRDGSQFHTVPRVSSQFHTVPRDDSQFHTVEQVSSPSNTVQRVSSPSNTVLQVSSQSPTAPQVSSQSNTLSIILPPSNILPTLPNSPSHMPLPPVNPQSHTVPPNTSPFHTVPPNNSPFHTVPPNTSPFHTVPQVSSQSHTPGIYRAVPPNAILPMLPNSPSHMPRPPVNSPSHTVPPNSQSHTVPRVSSQSHTIPPITSLFTAPPKTSPFTVPATQNLELFPSLSAGDLFLSNERDYYSAPQDSPLDLSQSSDSPPLSSESSTFDSPSLSSDSPVSSNDISSPISGLSSPSDPPSDSSGK